MAVKRLKRAVTRLLSQGLTPRQIALTVAIGTAIGVVPLLWGSTAICIVIAYVLGLNQAALQAVNYLTYPLQLALLVPFYCLGDRLIPWGPRLSKELFTVSGMFSGASAGAAAVATVKAVAAWAVTVPPVIGAGYLFTVWWLGKRGAGERKRISDEEKYP